MIMQARPRREHVSASQKRMGLSCLTSSERCWGETNADQTLALFLRRMMAARRMSGMMMRAMNQAG